MRDINKRDEMFFLFLNLDTVLRDSTLGELAWQTKQIRTILIKTEWTQTVKQRFHSIAVLGS